jgi:pantetheine-phosphate adenylyltransferase
MNKSKKFAEFIEPFEIRKKNLLKYMRSQNDKLDYQVFRLNDPYGPAIIDPEIEAMIVSDETSKSAEKCNVIRIEKKMPILQIVTVPCLPNSDDKRYWKRNL